MKKIKKSYFLFVFVLVSIFISCNKSEETSPSNTNTEISNAKQNETTWILGSDHSKGFWMLLKFQVGHTASQCGNSCLKLYGESYHADCRGFGNICNKTTKVMVSENIYNELMLIIMEEEGLEEFEIFAFPDRSLYITNPQNSSEQWLNIPEQILSMDSTLMQIIIQNIWFSEEAEFENE